MTYWFAVAITGGILAGFGLAAYVFGGRRSGSFVRFILRYLTVFLLLLLAEAGLVWLFPSVHTAMETVTAHSVAGLLKVTGTDPSATGSIISFGNPPLMFDVTVACLGGMLYWVFIGLVWAEARTTRRQRLLAILAGVALLIGFNLFRITFSVYLEWRTGAYVHDYFYALNMLFVLLLWAGWQWTLRPRPAPAVPSRWQKLRPVPRRLAAARAQARRIGTRNNEPSRWRNSLVDWLARNTSSIHSVSYERIRSHLQSVSPGLTDEEIKRQLVSLRNQGMLRRKQGALGGQYWRVTDKWRNSPGEAPERPGRAGIRLAPPPAAARYWQAFRPYLQSLRGPHSLRRLRHNSRHDSHEYGKEAPVSTTGNPTDDTPCVGMETE